MLPKAPDREAIYEFYFRAMLNGGFVGNLGIKDGPFEGWSQYVNFDGPWELRDTWGNSASGLSKGETHVFWGRALVFRLSYTGEYQKQALPFLRYVLRTTFKCRSFLGGRGKSTNNMQEYPGLSYQNSFRLIGDEIVGREEIWKGGATLLGWHDYKACFPFE